MSKHQPLKKRVEQPSEALVNDILLAVDSVGRVCGWDPRAPRALGYDADALLGLRVSALLPGADGPSTWLQRCAEDAREAELQGAPLLVRRCGGDAFEARLAVTQLELEGDAYYLMRLCPIGALDSAASACGTTKPALAARFAASVFDGPSPWASPAHASSVLGRAGLERELEAALGETRTQPELTHALLYIDVDRFRVVNEAAGFVGGNEVLREIGALLRSSVDSEDMLARLEGNAFAVLLRGCTAVNAVKVAERLREAVASSRFAWRECSFAVTVSVGVVAVRAVDDAATLVSLAEVACSAAKDEGRNRTHLYPETETPAKQRELRRVWEIGQALEQDRLELYFQPIVAVDGATDRRGYYELLLRMRDEDGRLVPARDFISVAERYDLIASIDQWVIREVLSRWVCMEVPVRYTLAVNLSGGSLNDERFLELLLRELDRRPVPARALCLEITETTAITSLSRAAHFMQQLKQRGVDFAIDDFGSGFSSFSYLKTLPVDYLKIDGQFVRNVGHDLIDRTLVAAIREIGAVMGIETIAECVEDAEVLGQLAELGVTYAQGHHLALPRPLTHRSELEPGDGGPALA